MFQSVLRHLRDAQTAELEEGGTAEAGFTLIELMVVLLIIAILLAIAIPTFLGVTGSANDRAAQSNLTNGLTEASAVFQANNQSYSGIITALSSSAPEFTWTAAATSCTTGQPNCISVASYDVAVTTDQAGVVLANMSKTGTCWMVAQLGATPAVVATTGFIRAAYSGSGVTGNEILGGANISTAGTYYAKITGSFAATHCNAAYPPTASGGFNWGSSYASAGVNAPTS
jgi:type IV pilus assembly protein PilA